MLEGDDGTVDLLVHEQPVLASRHEASVAARQLSNDAPGQQIRKLAHVVLALRLFSIRAYQGDLRS